MEQVLQLLKDKNHFLQKFYRINEAELLNFAEGNFDNLENFYKSRDSILDTIHRVDELMGAAEIHMDPTMYIPGDVKKTVVKELDFKNEIVNKILAQDLQLISWIEQAKTDIINELSQIRSARKVFKSYSSGPNKKYQIDEEA